MLNFENYAAIIISVFSFAVQLEAVTVNPLAPLCPTNKVAPRRRRYDNSQPRTFAEYYHLLKPDFPSSLQEKPQADAPDDCGEIEDYDENDISSVTPKPQSLRRKDRHHGQKGDHITHGTHYLLTQHHYHGIKPALSNRPTRPPPAGYFGTNSYTPPKPQEPTDSLKPVHEGGQDPQMMYRPGLVGAPIGHVVGVPQKHGSKTPSSIAQPPTSNRKPKYVNHSYIPTTTTQSNKNTKGQEKHERTRKYINNSGIIGSFVDLFF